LALLMALEGVWLPEAVGKAATLLASVVGQDLEDDEHGMFRIARRVAKNRIISTVDPDARHGHKTSARGFDGYKGHVAVDPDSELILATTVTAGNSGDASAVVELLADDLANSDEQLAGEPVAEQQDEQPVSEPQDEQPAESEREPSERLSVYGDSAYGSGELVAKLEQADAEVNCKVQPPVAPGGRFSKDKFQIDLDAGTVTCPAGHTVTLKPAAEGQTVHFAQACSGCPLAARCTTSKHGRTIQIGPYEAQLVRARQRQANSAWKADYKATRPKVERKISHLARRKHGGRRARVRGKPKVTADFNLLAAAVNLARLATLGLASQQGSWTATTA
jgi:hypothetical protein